MRSCSNEPASGESGETYLVGANSVLLTESRFGDYAPGKKYAHSESANRAIRDHADGSGMFPDSGEEPSSASTAGCPTCRWPSWPSKTGRRR